MSENRIPNRVRMIFPPQEPGTFKRHKDDNGDTLTTPTKGGRLDSSPSHLFDEHTRTWSRIDESKLNSTAKVNIMHERKSDHVPQRLMHDVTRAPSLDLNHTSNALDQTLASLVRSRKLDLAATEFYPNTSHNEKPESASSPDVNKLKCILDEFPSSNSEPSIEPDSLKSLVNQLSIEPNRSKLTKQDALKILIDALSKDDSSTTVFKNDQLPKNIVDGHNVLSNHVSPKGKDLT